MSAETTTVIRCDCQGCPDSADPSQCENTLTLDDPNQWVAVEKAQDEGWTVDREQHYCPECSGRRS